MKSTETVAKYMSKEDRNRDRSYPHSVERVWRIKISLRKISVHSDQEEENTCPSQVRGT